MVIYDKIVEDIHEPRNTNVLWLKPTDKGFAFYRYKNGRWEVLRIMNDKGTTTPDDDQPYDLDGVSVKNLADLADVSLNNITDGQVLKYDGTSWKNGKDDNAPGPQTVGTDQIIENSVEMQDLNDTVKDKIQKTYYQENESLHMDYDVANENG